MVISVDWYDNGKTILCMQFDGHWTWDDYVAAWAQINQLAETVSWPVGLMIVIPERLPIPRNVLSLAQHNRRSRHPNIALRVLVTTNDVARSLFRLFVGLNPDRAAKYRVVSTQAAALAVLNEQLAAPTD